MVPKNTRGHQNHEYGLKADDKVGALRLPRQVRGDISAPEAVSDEHNHQNQTKSAITTQILETVRIRVKVAKVMPHHHRDVPQFLRGTLN